MISLGEKQSVQCYHGSLGRIHEDIYAQYIHRTNLTTGEDSLVPRRFIVITYPKPGGQHEQPQS